ncbi:MAG: hypothetical protein QXL89_08525, partial [Nitrososphaeria archaeon]
VIVWTLLLLPTLIIAFYDITDNFNYRTVAYVKYYHAMPSLPIYEKTSFTISIGSGVRVHPLHELHFSMVEKILGLDSKTYQNFPLGIVLIILLYAMVTTQSSSYISKIIYLVPFAMFVYTSPLIGTYIPTYGFILFLSIFIALFKSKYGEKHEYNNLIVGLILIIALNFIYYTVHIALASILALSLILGLLLKNKSRIIDRDIMILVILLIMFSFNEIFYETIEKMTMGERIDLSFYSALLRLLGKIVGNIETQRDPYVFIARMSWHYSILNITRVLSLALISTIIPLMIIYKSLKDKRSLSIGRSLIFVVSISLMPVIITIIYVAYGGYVRYDLFFFVYPIIMSFIIADIRFKKLRGVFIALAIFVSLISILTYAFFIIEDKVVLLSFSYKDANAGYHYFSLGVESKEIKILSDFRTIGIFTVLLAENNIVLHPVFFNSEVYDTLLKGNISNKNVDFIVINRKLADRPTTSVLWNYYYPLEPFIGNITQLYELLYSDAYLYVIRPIC